MDVEIVYDKKYDILYLIFGKPVVSEAVWLAKGVYLRRDMVTDKLKGAIIEDYSSQDRDHLSYILPYPLNKHLPIIGEVVDIDNIDYLNSAYCVKLMVVRANRIQAMANFSKEELMTYQQLIEAEYVHNTTAIEGNKLRFNAVIGLLYDDGVKYSMRGITEREIVEVSNYKQVKIYSEERRTNKVTLDFIRMSGENH